MHASGNICFLFTAAHHILQNKIPWKHSQSKCWECTYSASSAIYEITIESRWICSYFFSHVILEIIDFKYHLTRGLIEISSWTLIVRYRMGLIAPGNYYHRIINYFELTIIFCINKVSWTEFIHQYHRISYTRRLSHMSCPCDQVALTLCCPPHRTYTVCLWFFLLDFLRFSSSSSSSTPTCCM